MLDVCSDQIECDCLSIHTIARKCAQPVAVKQSYDAIYAYSVSFSANMAGLPEGLSAKARAQLLQQHVETGRQEAT